MAGFTGKERCTFRMEANWKAAGRMATAWRQAVLKDYDMNHDYLLILTSTSQKKYTFADGLEFKPEDWTYCDGYHRRFWTEIQDGLSPAGRSQLTDAIPTPHIPEFSYDPGDGHYDSIDRQIRSYGEDKFIRNAGQSIYTNH